VDNGPRGCFNLLTPLKVKIASRSELFFKKLKIISAKNLLARARESIANAFRLPAFVSAVA